MIQIAILKPDDIRNHWDELLPFVEKGIAYSNNELTVDGVFKSLLDNHLLIASVFDSGRLIAAVTFEYTTFPSGMSVINIQLAGGECIDLWFEEIERIATELAIVQGCGQVYIIGRPGWGKKMKPLGYHPIHTVFAKEVQ